MHRVLERLVMLPEEQQEGSRNDLRRSLSCEHISCLYLWRDRGCCGRGTKQCRPAFSRMVQDLDHVFAKSKRRPGNMAVCSLIAHFESDYMDLTTSDEVSLLLRAALLLAQSFGHPLHRSPMTDHVLSELRRMYTQRSSLCL